MLIFVPRFLEYGQERVTDTVDFRLNLWLRQFRFSDKLFRFQRFLVHCL